MYDDSQQPVLKIGGQTRDITGKTLQEWQNIMKDEESMRVFSRLFHLPIEMLSFLMLRVPLKTPCTTHCCFAVRLSSNIKGLCSRYARFDVESMPVFAHVFGLCRNLFILFYNTISPHNEDYGRVEQQKLA